jgi:hypothetical protein
MGIEFDFNGDTVSGSLWSEDGHRKFVDLPKKKMVVFYTADMDITEGLNIKT